MSALAEALGWLVIGGVGCLASLLFVVALWGWLMEQIYEAGHRVEWRRMKKKQPKPLTDGEQA